MKSKTITTTLLLFALMLFSSSCTAVDVNTNTPNLERVTSSPSPGAAATPTETSVPSTPTLVPENAFIKGITLNDQGLDLNTEYSFDVIEQYIIPSGANYVALIPTCWSEKMSDTVIDCNDPEILGVVMGVSDTELVDAIQYLHSAGLRVILKPQALVKSVLVSNEEQKNRAYTEEQWDAWFESYTQFILHYARIAEEQQVDLFVVGNEQEETTYKEQGWRDIIAAVRNVYHGPLTYAANSWGFEASYIKFWDALDYIGTNSYDFGKVEKNNPSVEEMRQHWGAYLDMLEAMSNQYGKQVLITEMGARPVDGFNEGAFFDWQSSPYNGQSQADYYTAAFEALKGRPWLKGIILWDINTSPLQGGPNDIGYSFIGKPAEQVVRVYFEGMPMVPAEADENYIEDPSASMWIYREGLENGWYPWDDPEAVKLPKFNFPGGQESPLAISVKPSESKGLFLNYGGFRIDLAKYKWLEFYILTGERPPQGLIAVFEDWSTGKNLGSRIALVKDPSYIEGGAFLPGTWQRVRIPIADLGYANRDSTAFAMDILNCAWPCTIDPNADDFYIDNIRLVAGKPK